MGKISDLGSMVKKNEVVATEDQLNRVKKDWEKIADEDMEVEQIKGTFYAYGSELAVLRIILNYRDVKKARVGKDQHNGKWYFSLDT